MSTLLGRALSAFASQLLHDIASVSFLNLHYVSLSSVCVAALLSLMIPSPQYAVVNDWTQQLIPGEEEPAVKGAV